jgi:hypothetical protein
MPSAIANSSLKCSRLFSTFTSFSSRPWLVCDAIQFASLRNLTSWVILVLVMKVRDILKRLKADGWESVAMVGSHEQFTHPTKPG